MIMPSLYIREIEDGIMKNILLINPTIRPVGVELLKKECNVFFAPDGEEDTLIEYINKHSVEAVLTRVEKITRNIIESCKGLKVIGQHGVGLDNIDVAAASENGVLVLNVPDANYISVAEHAMMFILALSRRLLMADSSVRNGNWKFRETNIPMEVADKNLLIVGLGRIGRDVAKKAQAFNMKVMAYDVFVDADTMNSLGITKAESLEQGLGEADFISVHAPLTSETRGMISAEQFKLMKKTACIINLGRGPVINEEALISALKSNEIAGAGLDVLELEPPDEGNLLFDFSSVILTPHFGGDTAEAKDRCSTILARTAIDALNGSKPYNAVNFK